MADDSLKSRFQDCLDGCKFGLFGTRRFGKKVRFSLVRLTSRQEASSALGDDQKNAEHH